MKYFGIILMVGFVGISVFGSFGMHTQADMNMQGHDMPSSNCIGATAQGVDCPKQADPIDFATFHIDAFRGFSLATFGENLMGMLLLIFATLIFIGLAFFSPRLFKIPKLAFYRQHFRDFISSPQQQQLIRWLALHEKSPTTL